MTTDEHEIERLTALLEERDAKIERLICQRAEDAEQLATWAEAGRAIRRIRDSAEFLAPIMPQCAALIRAWVETLGEGPWT